MGQGILGVFEGISKVSEATRPREGFGFVELAFGFGCERLPKSFRHFHMTHRI